MRIPATACVLALAWLASDPRPAAAQVSADVVFGNLSSSVAKVEVFEAGASAPVGVGTAFFVGDGTVVLTNYHVVNDLVYEPEGFRAELVFVDGERAVAELLEVAAPDDLALLRVDAARPPLRFATAEPQRGTRLFSLGHPRDLSQAVVEGTFNGLVQHRFSPRYHFTGSVNPGMSGGPAVTAEGEVVGVNVSSAGNQLSFLVPASAAAALMERHRSADSGGRPLLERVREQIRGHTDTIFDGLVEAGIPTRSDGGFELPWGNEALFDCAAATISEGDDLYVARRHDCSPGDFLFSTQDRSFVLIDFTHFTLTSEELNPFQFRALVSQYFSNLDGWLHSETEDTGDYECVRDNVRNRRSLKLKVAFCARPNESLSGLFDVFVRTASVGGGSPGVVSTLRLSGVSMTTAVRFVQQYLDAFAAEG